MSPLTLSEPVAPATVPALPTRRLFTYCPEQRILLMDIDNTSLEHFAVCARSAEYRLVHSREGAFGTAALAYGSAKHLYLEHILRGGTVAEAEEIMVKHLSEHQDPDPNNWRTSTHAVDSMRGYMNYWHSQPLVPVTFNNELLVEVGFRLPLCEVSIAGSTGLSHARLRTMLTNPDECPMVPSLVRVSWTGRIDCVCPFLGDIYAIDHKTTSMVGPSYYDDFQLSSQMHGYVFAARHLWPELNVKGVRINTIIGRPPSKTGIQHAYERQTFVYSEEHLEEWHKDTQTLVADFLAHTVRNYFPKMSKWCVGRYGTCQYHPVCTSLPESRHIVLGSDLYKDCTWSPLNPRS